MGEEEEEGLMPEELGGLDGKEAALREGGKPGEHAVTQAERTAVQEAAGMPVLPKSLQKQ